MRDLEQIQQANTASIGEHIPGWRAAGKWVIATYTGLNFLHAAPYDTEGQARTELSRLEGENAHGYRYQLLEPLAVPGEDIGGEIRAIEPSGDGSAGATPDATSAAAGEPAADAGATTSVVDTEAAAA